MEALTALPLFGSIANAIMIICGAFLGLVLRKHLPEKLMDLPVQGMGLFVASLGISMSITSQHVLVVIAGITVGSVIGELLDIEGRIERGTRALEARCGDKAEGFSLGFITASILFCTGSMAVLGSFQEGLGGYPELLLTKGLMDGLISVAMAASLGFGVLFSAIPVLLYQGTLTLAAAALQSFMTETAVTEMTATGGLMLIAIGLNMLKLTHIRVMNMLPGLVIAVLLARIFY
ncbi:DUF554 domain-containing protein [Synergistaceae bacterium OttesenSCG-928-D05]|nr:DUF554 domain-containing protein [Synergistaceae bacterium OttesenSCG-928-D05]